MKKGTIDTDKVNQALAKYLPGFEGPWSVEKTKNGQSNPTFILSGKNKKLVLRKKPEGNLLKSAHQIDREFRVMSAIYKTTVPVPKMYYLCDMPNEIGTIFYVMEYIKGRNFLDPRLPGIDSQERKKIYADMNKCMAELHRINTKSVGLDNYGKPGNYFSRQLSLWSNQYDLSVTEPNEKMQTLKKWLEENLKQEAINSTLIHGDWRIDNLIFSDHQAKLVAVLDWELSTLGDPRVDLASQIMQWSMPQGKNGRGLEGLDRKKFGIPEDNEFIEEYTINAKLGDVPDLTFAIPFCFFRMGAILQGVRKRALDGNASNPEKAIKLGEYVSVFAQKALTHIGE